MIAGRQIKKTLLWNSGINHSANQFSISFHQSNQFKLKTFSLIDEIGNNRKLINEMELIAGNDKVDLRINELNEKWSLFMN